VMGANVGLAVTLAALGWNVQGLFPLFFLTLIIALISGGLIPSKLAIGVDGIHVRWLWQKRFLSMARVQRIHAVGDRGIALVRDDGTLEMIWTSPLQRNDFAPYREEHRDAVLARITEALAAYRARGPAADVSAVVAKGSRTGSEWLEALTRMREAEGGYRAASIRDDDLWRLVENPAAAADARAGAALLLRRSLDDAGKMRVRIAAEATASPKLRIALDVAASSDDEADVRAALEDLTDDDSPAKLTA